MRIQNIENLSSHGNKIGRLHVAQLLDVGMDKIDSYANTKRLVTRQKSMLIFQGKEFELAEDPRSGKSEYDLDLFERIIVIGAAKGVQECAVALEEILGDYLTGGHVIGKHGDERLCKKIGVTLAGHPTPDIYCEEGCRKIYEWINDVGERDFVITVTGSGVSSLMTWPIEGVSIQEMQSLTHMMQIKRGALTKDLNPIRAHLDRFKGGKISRLLKKATVVHLATNDLGGSSWNSPGMRDSYYDLMHKNCFIPTIADGSTFAQSVESFKKYDAWERVPKHIQNYLLHAAPEDETVKVTEYEAMNARLFKLTSKLDTIYPAMMEKAQKLGYAPYMLAETLVAEAAEAGKVLSTIGLNIQNMDSPVKAPCVLISSGELVVTVGESGGIGGRNQEFCIAGAQKIAGSTRVVIGAVDTDGTDGPGGFFAEDAPQCLSGAIVDGCTVQEASESGFNLALALKNHDTSEILWKLNSGIYATSSLCHLKPYK